MSPIVAELLFATVAALWIGARRPKVPVLLAWCIGLALITWLARLFLIAMFPANVTVSEDYLNGISLGNSAAEIALCALWIFAWSFTGMIVSRLWIRLRTSAN